MTDKWGPKLFSKSNVSKDAEIKQLRELLEDACHVFDHYDLPEHAFHYRRELERLSDKQVTTQAQC